VPPTVIGILPVDGQPGVEIVKFESGHEIGHQRFLELSVHHMIV
jgi:hypothetical protein